MTPPALFGLHPSGTLFAPVALCEMVRDCDAAPVAVLGPVSDSELRVRVSVTGHDQFLVQRSRHPHGEAQAATS